MPAGEIERPVLDHLRREVLATGATLKEVSRELGRSPDYLSQLLRGEIDLSLEGFYRILDWLGVRGREFFVRLEAGQRGEPDSPAPQGDVLELLEAALRAALENAPRERPRNGGEEGSRSPAARGSLHCRVPAREWRRDGDAVGPREEEPGGDTT